MNRGKWRIRWRDHTGQRRSEVYDSEKNAWAFWNSCIMPLVSGSEPGSPPRYVSSEQLPLEPLQLPQANG